MGLWDANSDLDYHDQPWVPRWTSDCAACGEGYVRRREDTGNLCDRCCALRDAEREVLVHAEQAIHGALIDLKQGVLKAATPSDAHALHQRITTLTAHTIQLEKLALDHADRLTKGAA